MNGNKIKMISIYSKKTHKSMMSQESVPARVHNHIGLNDSQPLMSTSINLLHVISRLWTVFGYIPITK